MRPPDGARMPGLKDLLDKLRAQKQQRMQRYDVGSSLEDIAKKLDDVVKTEREGIERDLKGREREKRQQALDTIPPDAAGRLRELQRYDFADATAEQKFQDLLASLRAQAMQPFMQGMKNALGNMTPEDLRRMREMIQDLNRMLRERAEGGQPDFETFKQKWGSQFPGAESLDDVLEQIAQRMAGMQSLMNSLSPAQRAQLDEMMRSLFLKDERLEAAMRQLGMHLSEMIDEMAQRYPFRGDEQIGLDEAMRLMEEMQKLDALEQELRGTRSLEDLAKLSPDDVTVIRTEQRTQAATVVMLDMSRSMLNNGYFLPAKKVALALSALIRSQFPRDALYIVGFSLYAREFTTQQLPTLSWSEWNMGTNMHAGFMLSRKLLARHAGGNRQILMVTDGEPTAHLEGEVADFSYPPTRRTVEETLKEVQRCTRERITINTFMLERSPWLTSFVEQMARINRGRAFFATPDRLGEYLVVDYVSARRRARGA